MIDQFGRSITYARISVTERCNLNCIYCSPSTEERCNVLSCEEITMLAQAFCSLGITKIRLTGGEPLVRTDIVDIIRNIASIPDVEDLPLTTNAIRLYDLADQLKDAGIKRLNISLDTLKPDRFKQITGVDAFEKVMKGIWKAMDIGMIVKLNSVLVKGLNDDEIDDFIELTKDNKFAVRFIEMMPIGDFGENNKDKVVSNEEIIAARPYLKRVSRLDDAVSETYVIDGYKGKVGFISPMTHKFCSTCNRVRTTADGKIKTCLGSDAETDLKLYLRTCDFEGLKTAIEKAVFSKPRGHNFESEDYSSNRNMSRIGG